MLRAASHPGVLQRLLLAAALVALAIPGPTSAQEVPAPDRERLEVFAKTFNAIAEARERGHAELARTHDPEGKERVREEMDREIEEAMEAHGMSVQEYEELTFLVSADAEYQKAFQEILAALSETSRE
jgi:hypothetical protein